MLLIEELERTGCQVLFVERPMSNDPHDQLLLQIRGAVAEYERSLIADRTRRGRWAKYVAGTLLPWSRPPYGYRLDPDTPGDPHGVHVEPIQAAVVAEMFAYYVADGHTLWGLTKHLTTLGIKTLRGRAIWRKGTVRTMLTNPTYTGNVYVGRHQLQPRRGRRSPLQPVGRQRTDSRTRAARDAWTWVAHVPAIVSQAQWDQVQAKLTDNQAKARRNNTAHPYLLRALVSCGTCGLAWRARTSGRYSCYECVSGKRRMESGREHRCPARSIRTPALDALVWADLCAVVQQPALITHALERAHGGHWLPQELHARRTNLRKAQATLDRHRERLTEAYLAEIVGLDEYKRRRQDLEARHATLVLQEQQLEGQVTHRHELVGMIESMEAFCARVAQGLAAATFAQRRQVVELLIDRVVVHPDEIEIRYVLPMSSKSEHIRFCHLRSDYADLIAQLDQGGCQRDPVRAGRFQHDERVGRRDARRGELGT